MNNIFQFKLNEKFFKATLLAIIILEFFSLFAFIYPILNRVFFLLILFAALILTWRRLEYGIYIVLAELTIASKGYLFYWELGDKSISIRIALFAVVMVIWAVRVFGKYIKDKKIKIAFLKSRLFPYYLILFFLVSWGVISGFLNQNSFSNIFLDFNGWIYFALIFPFFEAIKSPPRRDRQENFNAPFSVLLAAVTALTLKTFILLFIFSHGFVSVMPQIYRWIRVTGVGEITDMGSGFYRIFFQSHIYAIFGFFALFPLLNKKFVHNKERIKGNKFLLLFSIAFATIILVGFSRSFWVGLFVTFFIFYFISLFIFKEKFKHLVVSVLLLFTIFLSGIYLAGIVIKVPLPVGEGGGSLISAIGERTTKVSEEAAVGSRWNLINPLWQKIKEHPLLGSGFGTTVTYKTEDPRALENNTDGLYTTYAFEWGYLDIWLKLGIFGLLAYLYLLWKIFKLGWKSRENLIILGSLFGLIALSVIHFFTPYLNHPLGIGYLLLLSVIFEKYRLAQNFK